MRNLFFHLFLLLYYRWLVIDLNCFFHPLIFEFLYLTAAIDTRQFESNSIAVDTSRQKLQCISKSKSNEVINLGNNNSDNFIFLFLPKVVGLQRTAYNNMLVLNLAKFLHVEIHCWYFGDGWEDMMQLLGKIFRVSEDDKEALLLINEFFYWEKYQSNGFAWLRWSNNDYVMYVVFDLKQLMLKISRHIDF